MQKLVAELHRLYLLASQSCNVLRQDGSFEDIAVGLTPAQLEQHLQGEHAVLVDPVTDDSHIRTLVLHFGGGTGDQGALHWHDLCAVANALQGQLGLPAPAVSVSDSTGFSLWLSLATPLPLAQATHFIELLHQANFSAADEGPVFACAATVPPVPATPAGIELPPCRNPRTGLWAAFINPSMGDAFIDAPGLEMAPTPGAQAAFLAGLHTISALQFAHAIQTLQRQDTPVMASPPITLPQASRSVTPALPEGLLLKDASVEEIVRVLHARGIEPTLRYLLMPG